MKAEEKPLELEYSLHKHHESNKIKLCKKINLKNKSYKERCVSCVIQAPYEVTYI